MIPQAYAPCISACPFHLLNSIEFSRFHSCLKMLYASWHCFLFHYGFTFLLRSFHKLLMYHPFPYPWRHGLPPFHVRVQQKSLRILQRFIHGLSFLPWNQARSFGWPIPENGLKSGLRDRSWIASRNTGIQCLCGLHGMGKYNCGCYECKKSLFWKQQDFRGF